ncbi:MAG TPA: Ppx/GppA family phosphatase [Alphaproteobacteria bacterium]|nr:Ppx/GppA family phosphatase [Alphaproteobacteria bacterium]
MATRPDWTSNPGRNPSGRLAVIDIGSNSIRLVVYERLTRSPVALFNEKVLCGLGRTLEKTGQLDPEGVGLALQNLARFQRLAEGMGVERLDVVATAAVRDAVDGAAFVEKVGRTCGLDVTTISGEEEARLSALGVVSGTPGADGLMGDLGGGSLECVTLDHGLLGNQATMPLGPFRLMELTGKRDDVARHIDQHLASLPWLREGRGRTFYPVGGAWRALATLHMERIGHPVHIIHQYDADAATIRDFAKMIATASRGTLERMDGLAKRRIETLPLAALVLERVLRHVEPARVVFSAYGLREGLLFDLLPPDQQAEDPLLAACAAVERKGSRYGLGDELAAWTAPLFVGEDFASGRLRRAACLLADLGWAEHPDYRCEHAYLRTMRMVFAGIDHHERAFLALAIHARYGGRPDDPLTAGGRALVGEGMLNKALVLGSALRLAFTLSGGSVAILHRSGLRLADDRLELVLTEEDRVLLGEALVRRLEVLAKPLGKRPAVVTG